ncbi:uncharacterized protein LOC135209511 [Macrobrachium nipponense]|uniref:uncharacterized protein LOC135209511 n=1 Tax=Macrobrachium nipponense TaxID=159736 RepID=UPI0030C87FC8
MYCDGSVNGIKVGCRVVIRECYENDVSTDETLYKRIGDKTSTTAAELHVIYEESTFVVNKMKDVFVFVDCQSALLALNSRYPVGQGISKGKELVYATEDQRYFVKFFWVPSHVGIHLNEMADSLAKDTTNKQNIDTGSTMTLSRIKEGLRIKRSL